MTGKRSKSAINTAVLGSPDFCRRFDSMLNTLQPGAVSARGNISEAWSLLLSSKPQLVLIEMAEQYSDRRQASLRKLLSQLRERLDVQPHVALVLNSPEQLLAAGDLLFANAWDFSPSLFIDTMLAAPPAGIPSAASLRQQLSNLLEMLGGEIARQGDGKPPLPALGAAGWVASLADPQSRELWMKWLPRYASYTNENPLIIGATGTGKTNLALALHLLSGRKGEFIAITPRDFSSSELVQAELFGAVAGAYTGAVDKWGLVKRAEKGTLFIDELQSIDKDLQGKLITFIENKIYRRVGSSETVSADVRFVFAANRTLPDMLSAGILRDDFAYRLERVQLELLPLASRRLDIVAAMAYALAKIQRQRPDARPVLGMDSAAYRALFCQPWPGNLRQLENSIARLCEICDINGTSLIDTQTTSRVLGSRVSSPASSAQEIVAQAASTLAVMALENQVLSLNQGLEKLTEIARLTALETCGGETARAAELLGENENVLKVVAASSIARASLEKGTCN